MLLAAAAALAGLAAPASDAPIADSVLRQLQRGRKQAGVRALDRRPALDAVALERAREIAAQPEERRLRQREPIDRLLERAGIRTYRRAVEHLDLKRGYPDPAAAFAETWKNYGQAWESAMDSRMNAVGLASVTAPDGWRILVGVLVQDRRVPKDLRAVERATVREINEIRRKRDLPRLVVLEPLVDAARGHSAEMARMGYFDHVSPTGLEPADRVRARGVAYRKVAENIQLNDDPADPVAVAVESWMNSPGHRRNILDPDFTRTGVGVAVDAEGVLYFTQVFLRPSEPAP